jgi:hypothetical protein
MFALWILPQDLKVNDFPCKMEYDEHGSVFSLYRLSHEQKRAIAE